MSVKTRRICREITTEAEFAELQADWNGLLTDSSYPSPFSTWEWAWEWWRHFGTGKPAGYRLVIAQAYASDGTLIGLAPFFFPGTSEGLLRLRPLRPLATRIECTRDDMTEEPIILLRQGRTEEALQGIWAALQEWKGRQGWDLIHLRLLRPVADPPLFDLWRGRPKKMPFLLTNSYRQSGQTRSLPATWAEFRSTLSKSMKDNTAYYPRLLTREGHPWSVKIARTPEEVAQAVPTLIRLHGSRAQSRRGPAHVDHLPSRAHRQFLEDVLVRLSARSMAAVGLLFINGKPVGAQSVLEIGGRMTFYYSGFDPEWHRYSPITVIHIALIQDAITRRLAELDYLPGVEPWKTRWGTEPAYVFDELSCLSIHPRAVFRSAWRKVIFQRSKRRGLACACGFCSLAEQSTESLHGSRRLSCPAIAEVNPRSIAE